MFSLSLQNGTGSLSWVFEDSLKKNKGDAETGISTWLPHRHWIITDSVYQAPRYWDRCYHHFVPSPRDRSPPLRPSSCRYSKVLWEPCSPTQRVHEVAYQVCNHLLHVLSAFFHLVLGASELHNITFLCWVWKVDDNLKQITRRQCTIILRLNLGAARWVSG